MTRKKAKNSDVRNIAQKKDTRYADTVEACAGAVIVDADDRILLVQSQKWDGKYSIAGGHIEFGEPLADALVREVREELGIDVKIVDWLPPSEWITPQRHFLFTHAVCRYDGDKDAVKPCAEEFQGEPAWKTVDEWLADTSVLGDGIEELLQRYKVWCSRTEALAGWQRCLADFDNYKKRQAESAKTQAQYAAQDLVTRLLPVLDNFQASVAHVPAEHADSPWVTGLSYIHKQLNDVLAESGVAVMEVTVGDVFDPARHEAVHDSTNASERAEKEEEEGANKKDSDAPQKIAKVVSQGYMMGDKVLRPARVVVK